MAKNIMICCDGTDNDVTKDPTNVFWVYRCLNKTDQQLVYYDSGVGTLPDPTSYTSIGRFFTSRLDSAIGHSVAQNVQEAYRFLARHYQAGDRVYLFGFSRGAYTVRALAGMIRFLGLVRPELVGQTQLAWTIYADCDFASGDRFCQAFSIDPAPTIHLTAVWDTVSAYGWLWGFRTSPYTSSNPLVSHVRHAVAIDEARSCFRANIFRPDEGDYETFRQLWFAGAHADVGGGYPEAESGLSKIAFEWMVRESRQLGAEFDEDEVKYVLGQSEALESSKMTPPDVMGVAHNSTRGMWKSLEFLPRKQWDHDASPPRMRWFGPNLFGRRKIPDDAVFHSSVERKLAEDKDYRPKNLPDPSKMKFED